MSLEPHHGSDTASRHLDLKPDTRSADGSRASSPHTADATTNIDVRHQSQSDGYERTCLGNSAHDAMVNNVLASQPGKVAHSHQSSRA